MERYDYHWAVREDVREYLEGEYTPDELREKLEDRDDFEQELYDELFVSDSVTGNASGSYYCNAWRAEEAICHNLDLLADAFDEFGGCGDVLRDGAEACDVTIRCYLLAGAVSDVLDDLADELEESEEEA